MDVGVKLCPSLDPAVQFVVGSFAEVFFPDSYCEDRRITQSRLVHCVFDDRLIIGVPLHSHDDPVGPGSRRVVRRPDDCDWAVCLFGQTCCR